MDDTSAVIFLNSTSNVPISPTKAETGTSAHIYHAPRTVDELFVTQNFYQMLAQGFVFIHNKKDASDRLVQRAMSVMNSLFNFEFFETHLDSLDTLLKRIQTHDNTTYRNNRIVVIDHVDSTQNISRFCLEVSALNDRIDGIWLRGFISDLNPSIIALFDTLFIFDTSHQEYEILRTCISIPPVVLKRLQDSNNMALIGSETLCFVNYGRMKNAPLFAHNPMIVLGINGGTYQMSIVEFVPVIVEASKFLFNEASKWLEEARRRSPSEKSETKIAISLPVTRDQVILAESDPSTIARFIDSSITTNDTDEIKTLMEQVRLARAVLGELEKQEELASGEELAKTRVLIRERARLVVVKIERLNAALNRVYVVQ